MSKDLGRILIGVCLGVALTLLVDSFLRHRESNSAAESDVHQAPARLSQQRVYGTALVSTGARAPARRRTPVSASAPVGHELSHAEFRTGEGTLQQDKGLRAAPLNALLNAITVRCDFDPGAGAYWSAGNVETHGVSYSGGEIVYQSIDIENGSAQMTGTPGATGSTTGELDVRVTANNAGLHFAGFTPAGSLIVTSVYASVSPSGRYLAVMSRHGQGRGHESIQVYGACDIGAEFPA